MRAPRYRFPDRVRETTRSMAARMVRQGSVPQSSDQLREWISDHPAEQTALQQDGYGEHFDAGDLFPLLEVFVTQAGGRIAPVVPPARRQPGIRPVYMILTAVLIGLLLALLILL